jgi:hypothetical protein
MTTIRTAVLGAVVALLGGAHAWGQSNAGHVNFLGYAQSNYDYFTYSPSWQTQQFFQQKYDTMVVWSPYFDSRTGWYGNAVFYHNLYGIEPGSWVQYAHPEWILHDGNDS